MQKARPFVALLIICLVLTGSYYLYRHYYASPSGQIEASGTIEATRVELHAKNSGTIRQLTLKEGDFVQADQVVAVLERNDLVAQRERDAMNLLAAEDKLQELLSGAREQEIEAAQANVNVAQVNLEQAEKELERTRTLYEGGAVSQSQWETAQNSVDIKKQQLTISQAQLELLQAGSKPEAVATARAQVKSYQAILKASQAVLDDLRVSSPIAGIITSKGFENGEFIQAGSTLVAVTDTSNLWIKVYIPTDDLPSIKLNQAVRISVSGSSQVFSGVVKEIASQGEYTPKTIQTKKERTNVVYGVKITVENIDGILKPGMPADVVFDRS